MHISLGLGKSTGRISSYASHPITPKEAILRDLASHSDPRAGAGTRGIVSSRDRASAAPHSWAERSPPHKSQPPPPPTPRTSHHTCAERGLSTGRKSRVAPCSIPYTAAGTGPALCIDYRGSTPRAWISDLTVSRENERLDRAVSAALGATPRTAMSRTVVQKQQVRALRVSPTSGENKAWALFNCWGSPCRGHVSTVDLWQVSTSQVQLKDPRQPPEGQGDAARNAEAPSCIGRATANLPSYCEPADACN